MLLTVIFCCCLAIAFSQQPGNVDPIVTKHACEGEMLHLSCPREEQVLTIRKASYGRSSSEVCNLMESSLWDRKNCRDSRSTVVVINKCAEQKECSVVATDQTFRDQCPSIYKYLEVAYQCLDNKTGNANETAQENQQFPGVQSLIHKACFKELVSVIQTSNGNAIIESPLHMGLNESCQMYGSFQYCMYGTWDHCTGNCSSKYSILCNIMKMWFTYACKRDHRRLLSMNQNCIDNFIENSTVYTECRVKYLQEMYSIGTMPNVNTASCEFINFTVSFADCASKDLQIYCKNDGLKIIEMMKTYHFESMKDEQCPELIAKFAKKEETVNMYTICPLDEFYSLCDCEATKNDYSQLYLWTETPLSIINPVHCARYRSLKNCRQSVLKKCKYSQKFSHHKMIKLFYEDKCDGSSSTSNQNLNMHQKCLENVQDTDAFNMCQNIYQKEAYDLYRKGQGYLNQYLNNCDFINAMYRFVQCLQNELTGTSFHCEGLDELISNELVHYGNKLFAIKCSIGSAELPTISNERLDLWVCQNFTENLECPSGRVITIWHSIYGRVTSKINTVCLGDNDVEEIKSCNNTKISIDAVKKRCDGYQNCTVTASDSIFGEICPTIPKYLRIIYDCNLPKRQGHDFTPTIQPTSAPVLTTSAAAGVDTVTTNDPDLDDSTTDSVSISDDGNDVDNWYNNGDRNCATEKTSNIPILFALTSYVILKYIFVANN